MDVSEIKRGFLATELDELNSVEQRQLLQLDLILIDTDLLILNRTLENLNHLLADLVLRLDSVYNPVIELLVDLSRVCMDFLENRKGPGIDQGQPICENLFFLLEDNSLRVLPDLSNNWILVNKVIEFSK